MSILSYCLTSSLMRNPLTPEESAEHRRLEGAAQVFLVPCSQRKCRASESEHLPASQVYAGTAFRISATLLERKQLPWMILSGGYGFIQPATPIRSYEHRIVSPRQDLEWLACAVEVVKQRFPFLLTVPRLVILGSRHYAEAATEILLAAGRPPDLPSIETPVIGLPIGRMNQALSRASWSAPRRVQEVRTSA